MSSHYPPGQSGNPAGRPTGSRNKRDAEIWARLEARGDLDPADLLSSIVTNTQDPKELRAQAANMLLPYKYSKRGSIAPLRYIEEPLVDLPKATAIDQAIKNISHLSDLKASGKLDLDFADSLVSDNRAILIALIEEAKLIAHGQVTGDQTIHIQGDLPVMPGLEDLIMPVLHNGHEINGELAAPLPPTESIPLTKEPSNGNP
jgi:Family of unknown function (DUF5681)